MDQAAVFNSQMFAPAFRNQNSSQRPSSLGVVDKEIQKKGKGQKSKKSKSGGKGYRKTAIVKGRWNTEEDRLLVQLVKQYGDSKWARVAEKVYGRIAKQCKDRWRNHLRSDLSKEAWSEEEDKLLIAIHKEVGNKWSEIAKRLPGRSKKTIKNRWNATKRQTLSSKGRGKTMCELPLVEYIRSVHSSSSSQDQISIKQNNVNNSQVIEEPKPTLQPNFSTDVAATLSSPAEGCNLEGMSGYIQGGIGVYQCGSEFDQLPSYLAIHWEFDFQKELDFLMMLYQ